MTTSDLLNITAFPGSIPTIPVGQYTGTIINTTSTSSGNESVINELKDKIQRLENKVDNLTSRISELENPNRCKLDPEIGAVICDL